MEHHQQRQSLLEANAKRLEQPVTPSARCADGDTGPPLRSACVMAPVRTAERVRAERERWRDRFEKRLRVRFAIEGNETKEAAYSSYFIVGEK